MNGPYLSESLGDFWGRRYNLVVSYTLRHTIYHPIVRSKKHFKALQEQQQEHVPIRLPQDLIQHPREDVRHQDQQQQHQTGQKRQQQEQHTFFLPQQAAQGYVMAQATLAEQQVRQKLPNRVTFCLKEEGLGSL
jgi:hypothetical protein